MEKQRHGHIDLEANAVSEPAELLAATSVI